VIEVECSVPSTTSKGYWGWQHLWCDKLHSLSIDGESEIYIFSVFPCDLLYQIWHQKTAVPRLANREKQTILQPLVSKLHQHVTTSQSALHSCPNAAMH